MNVEAKVIFIIADLIGDSPVIEPSSRLIRDLGMDSLDMVELVLSIEEDFHMEINERDFPDPGWNTVADVISYIKGYQASKGD